MNRQNHLPARRLTTLSMRLKKLCKSPRPLPIRRQPMPPHQYLIEHLLPQQPRFFFIHHFKGWIDLRLVKMLL
jgi:hypothetical protein